MGVFSAFSLMTGNGNRTGPSGCGEPAMCEIEKTDDAMLLRLGHGGRTENEAISAIAPGLGNRTGHRVMFACALICSLILMFLLGSGSTVCEARGQIRACDVSCTEFDCATVAVGASCHPCLCRLLPSLLLPITRVTIDSKGVIKTTATSIEKHVNTEQHQQIIRTSIVWSGCSTFSYVHPMRAVVHLGSLRVVALIDTGSDYDAIDRDLSVVQHEQGNQAYRQRRRSSESVVGFSHVLKMRSEYVSQWELTLTGAQVFGGEVRSVTFTC